LAGSCYRAAGWVQVGLTTGRTRNDDGLKPRVPAKSSTLKPLGRRPAPLDFVSAKTLKTWDEHWEYLRQVLGGFPDRRTGDNTSYAMEDIGLARFRFSSPSVPPFSPTRKPAAGQGPKQRPEPVSPRANPFGQSHPPDPRSGPAGKTLSLL